MKTLPIILLSIALCSCATRDDGTKTFAGLDTTQWLTVGVKSGAAYLGERDTPTTSGKDAVEVTAPAPTWYESLLHMFL